MRWHNANTHIELPTFRNFPAFQRPVYIDCSSAGNAVECLRREFSRINSPNRSSFSFCQLTLPPFSSSSPFLPLSQPSFPIFLLLIPSSDFSYRIFYHVFYFDMNPRILVTKERYYFEGRKKLWFVYYCRGGGYNRINIIEAISFSSVIYRSGIRADWKSTRFFVFLACILCKCFANNLINDLSKYPMRRTIA